MYMFLLGQQSSWLYHLLVLFGSLFSLAATPERNASAASPSTTLICVL